MPITTATNYDYLIDFLRLRLGDTDPATYRYQDSWLRTALVAAIRASGRWLNNKYLLDTNYNVYRNPNAGASTFLEDSPPIIEERDEIIFLLLASIIIKQGSIENSAWDLASWKDAEISYSNLESGRQKDASIKRDWEELKSIIKDPVKRLAWIKKSSLPGFKDNQYEKDINSLH